MTEDKVAPRKAARRGGQLRVGPIGQAHVDDTPPAPTAPASSGQLAAVTPTPGVSDFASMLASTHQNGHGSVYTKGTIGWGDGHANGSAGGTTIPIGALVRGRPDPEFDRIQLGTRQRRDVVETLNLLSTLTHRPVQAVVQDALLAYLRDNAEVVFSQVHGQLYG